MSVHYFPAAEEFGVLRQFSSAALVMVVITYVMLRSWLFHTNVLGITRL